MRREKRIVYSYTKEVHILDTIRMHCVLCSV